MTNVVSAVNFITSHGLNHKQFKAVVDKIKSGYGGTTVEFIVLLNIRFCIVFCHY